MFQGGGVNIGKRDKKQADGLRDQILSYGEKRDNENKAHEALGGALDWLQDSMLFWLPLLPCLLLPSPLYRMTCPHQATPC